MQHVYNGIRRLFLICFVAAAVCILFAGGMLAVVCIAAGVVWLLRRHVVIPRFTLWLLLGGFALRLMAILVLRPPIISDYLVMLQASQQLLGGDTSFQHWMYFSLWSYQSVFVVWQTLFLAIWNHVFMLKLVSALLGAGTVCLIYRLARDHVRESAAQAAALLLTAFPFAWTLPTILTNQISSAFFLVLGMWLLLCRDCTRLGRWRYVLACIAVQFGNLLRSEGIILVVAALAYAGFAALRRPQRARRIVCGGAVLLVLYAALGVGADAAVRASGLNENGTKNGYPAWKFITGLNFNTAGSYSSDDWNALCPTFDDEYRPTAETAAVEHALLAERLSAGPKALLLHAVRKMQFLWCNDALYWAFGHLKLSRSQQLLYDNIQKADRLLFYGALLLAVSGLAAREKRRALEPAALLPYFVVFAACCAFLLIEVQPRYAYLPQLFLFCDASLGLDRLMGKEGEHAEDLDRRALL